MLRWSFILHVASLVVSGRWAAGQAPVSTDQVAASHTMTFLPQPLLAAAFPLPTRPLDWQQYQTPEDCDAVFSRTRYAGFALERQAELRVWRADTVRVNPWAPLPAAAVQIARRCLARFSVATIPTFAFDVTTRLAAATNADTLLQAIVARHLTTIPVTAVAERANLLQSVIEMLSERIQEPHWWYNDFIPWTPAHLQLAHAYTAQLDTLGPTVYQQRIVVRQFLGGPAQYAHDIDAQLALAQEALHLESLMRSVTISADQTLDVRRLLYLKTLSRTDLLKLLAPIPVPALHCDYYFPTPATTTPVTTAIPQLPLPQQLSLLFFLGGGTESYAKYPVVRRLRLEFPTTPIIIETQLTGTFADRLLVEHPEEEAILRHQYVADSLGLPGAFCVAKNQYHMEHGHAIPSADPNKEAYLRNEQRMELFVIDPTGVAVSGFQSPMLDWDDLQWYLQRWQTTNDPDAANAASSSHPTP